MIIPQSSGPQAFDSGWRYYLDKRYRLIESGPPPCVIDAPGMLSPNERAMLYGLVRDHYEGIGAIVDGGSFFGSSVVSEAQGLRDNRRVDIARSMRGWPAGKAIQAYEIGFLPGPPNPKVDPYRTFNGTTYRLGDSFVPMLEAAIAPYEDMVNLTVGDLNEESWPGSPIELCFIDVCKTGRLNAHVSRQFFPLLIEERSILINQDFFFDRLPFIKVTMGYLAEYFEWVGRVSSSSIYRCVKAVPADVAAYDPYLARDPRCFDYHAMHPREGLDDEALFAMDLSEAYLKALFDRKDEALAQCGQIRERYAHIMEESRERALLHSGEQGGMLRDATFRIDRAERQIDNGVVNRVM